ncbi:MAG: Mycothiol S-conjugate amidase [Anaerolineales bacterium]|nr:Mycothiol S-conjugate amidase [Anaerolineales bacterium]
MKLLAVFAHPDDESMGLGGTLAKYAAEGVETYLVCATRGERGWWDSEGPNPGLEGVGKIRTKELENAGKILGLKEIHFLNYIDGDLDQANPSEAIGKIVTHLRRIKPDVVVTFAHDGAYGHPDHIAISQFATAALVCAADGNYHDADNFPPYRVSKLYYFVDTEAIASLYEKYLGPIEFPVDDQVRGESPWKDWMITTRVDVSAHSKTAWEACLCHKSQLPSLAPLMNLPVEEVQKLLEMQGTFYRAMSSVNGGRKVETDLFEGLTMSLRGSPSLKRRAADEAIS